MNYELIEPGVSPYGPIEDIQARLDELRSLPQSQERDDVIRELLAYLAIRQESAQP